MPKHPNQTTPAIPAEVNKPLLGIGLTLAGGMCFSIQDAGIKWVTAEVAVLQVLFLRSVFGLLLLSGSTLLTGERIAFRVQRPWLLLTRTLINVLSWILFFYGLKLLPIATAIALFFSFPLFLTLFSVPLLSERVGARRIAAIGVGFVGVLFITNPTAAVDWSMLYMLGAAMGWALVATITRILGKSENTSTMLFHTLLAFAFLLAIPQPWIWESVISTPTLVLILFATVFGVAAQFFLTKAYAIALPSLIAPFEYTALIWAALIGYFVWGDVHDLPAIAGALLIVGSGIYIIHRETLLQRRKK